MRLFALLILTLTLSLAAPLAAQAKKKSDPGKPGKMLCLAHGKTGSCVDHEAQAKAEAARRKRK